MSEMLSFTPVKDQVEVPGNESTPSAVLTVESVSYRPGQKPVFYADPTSPWGFGATAREYPEAESPQLIVDADGFREFTVELTRGLVEKVNGSLGGAQRIREVGREVLEAVLSLLNGEDGALVRAAFESALKIHEEYVAEDAKMKAIIKDQERMHQGSADQQQG